jgi:hypothetical protein
VATEETVDIIRAEGTSKEAQVATIAGGASKGAQVATIAGGASKAQAAPIAGGMTKTIWLQSSHSMA